MRSPYYDYIKYKPKGHKFQTGGMPDWYGQAKSMYEQDFRPVISGAYTPELDMSLAPVNTQLLQKPAATTPINKIGQFISNLGQQGLTSNPITQGLSSLGIGASSGLGGLGNIANEWANTLGGIMNPNGNSTTTGKVMNAVGNVASMIPGVGGLIGAGVNMMGNYINTLFGSNLNEDFINATNDAITDTASFTSTASDTNSLMNEYDFMSGVRKKDVGTEGIFSNKATRKTRQLNEDIFDANLIKANTLQNAAEDLQENNIRNALMNTYAKGGSIHIKPSKRGTFTAAAKKHGKSVQAFASQVLANKDNYSPALVKKANFARNSKKWRHDGGGYLDTNASIFLNDYLKNTQLPSGMLGEIGEEEYNNYIFNPNTLKNLKDYNALSQKVKNGEASYLDVLNSGALPAYEGYWNNANWENAALIDDYLEQKNLSLKQRAALLTAIQRESNFEPSSKEKGVKIGGVGLFQFTASHRDNYYNWLKDNKRKDDYKSQIDYFIDKYIPQKQKEKQKSYGDFKFNNKDAELDDITQEMLQIILSPEKAVREDPEMIQLTKDKTQEVYNKLEEMQRLKSIGFNYKKANGGSLTWDDLRDYYDRTSKYINPDSINTGLASFLSRALFPVADPRNNSYQRNIAFQMLEGQPNNIQNIIDSANNIATQRDLNNQGKLESIEARDAIYNMLRPVDYGYPSLDDEVNMTLLQAHLKDNKSIVEPINSLPKELEKVTISSNINNGYYTIQSGDTLSKISKKLGISIRDLADANNIQNINKIYAGQKLKLPTRRVVRQEVISRDNPVYNNPIPVAVFNPLNDSRYNKLKALGGLLDMNNNGVTQINEGGTHEENPFEGVQMGLAPDGQPNLVEEGEVIWNDYVFSDRLKLGKGKNARTFAQEAKRLQKESEERPNDPISKNGLFAAMNELAQTQEMVRQSDMNKHRFDDGGTKVRYPINAGVLGTMYPESKYGNPIISMNLGEEGKLVGVAKPSELDGYYLMNTPYVLDGPSFGWAQYDTHTKKNTPTIPDITIDLGNWFKPRSGRGRTVASVETPIDLEGEYLNSANDRLNYDWNNTIGVRDNLWDYATDTYNRVTEPQSIRPEGINPLRLAPVLGSGAQVVSDWFTKPDYSLPRRIREVNRHLRNVGYRPTGQKMGYTPIDRDYLLRGINQQGASNARNIVGNSGGNSGMALMGLLANGQNVNENIGNALMQADEANNTRLAQILQFNNAIDALNSQGQLNADQINSQIAVQRAENDINAATAAEEIRRLEEARRSQNVATFLQNVGNLGSEIEQRNWLSPLLESGALEWKKCKGGKLNRRKKGGKHA